MKSGDVIETKSLNIELGSAQFGYRAQKGKRFICIYLGMTSDSEPLDPDLMLRQMGWIPESEVSNND